MVKVLAYTHPLRDTQVEADVADGQTIREIVGDVPVHAWIDGREVPAELLAYTRPKAGTTLIVRPVPRGGDPLRAVLQIGVVVAAAAATVATGGALAPVFGATMAGAIGAGVGAAVAIGGNLLINQLVPPQLPSFDRGGESFNRLAAFTGTSNQVAAFKPIPCLYGEFRFYPPLPMTGTPYTELSGSDQYMRMILVLGYGPLEIGGVKAGGGAALITESTTLTGTPIRIGDTDISLFDDVEFEIGDPDDITLYSNQVIETNPGWTTDVDMSGVDREDDDIWITDGDTATRTTDSDANEISIDLTFPAGLFGISSGGNVSFAKVEIKVEYRLVGTSSWTARFNPWVVRSSKKETFRVGRRWKVPAGQYEVRLTRVRTFFSEAEVTSAQMVWTALRTIRSVKPFVVPNTVVMALRIRATDQIQGRLDNVNIEATRMVPVYNGSTWVTQATRTPAWSYVDVFTGVANSDPIDKADIDTAEMLAWAAETDASGRYYDGVFDDNGTVFARAQEVATTGRASFALSDDAKVSVVRDTAQTTPKMVISPRNSFGFSSTLAFPKPPHAYRVRFIDPDTYEDSERIAYDDGYTAANATRFEVLQTKGCKSSDQAWKDGRYHLAQMRLRPEVFTFSQDVQHLRYRRGDLLSLRHDVILVGLGAGRVKSVTTDSNGDVTAFTCDETLFMAPGGIGTTWNEMGTATWDETTGSWDSLARNDYGVKIQKSDGTVSTVAITTVTPSTRTVTLDTPVTGIQPGDHFVFGEVDKESIDVKVAEIAPRGDFIAQITCVPAAPDILDAETGDIPDYDPVLTKPIDINSLPPPIPEIVTIRSDESVMLRDTDGSFKIRMLVFVQCASFPGSLATMQARIRNQTDDVWVTSLPQDLGSGVFIFEAVQQGDTYDIQVRSTRDGRVSRWSPVKTHTVVGKSSNPPSVTSFFVSVQADGTRKYTWDTENQPVDVRGYEIRYVRGTTWTSWDSALHLHDGLIPISPWESNLLPVGDYVFGIKAQDTSGNQSETETTLQVSLSSPRLRAVIYQLVPSANAWGQSTTWDQMDDTIWDETGSWDSLGGDGIIENAFINDRNELEAVTDGGWDSLADTWDALGDTWASIGTTADPITFTTSVIDLGIDVNFTPIVAANADGTATITMSTGTDGDGNVSGVFVPLARVKARYCQIKVSVTNPDGVAILRFLEVLIDSPVEIINYNDINTAVVNAIWFERIAAGHFKVATQRSMASITTAAIRAFQNVGSGWTAELLSKSATIFGNSNPAAEFKIYNSAGTLSDAIVDIELKGPKS